MQAERSGTPLPDRLANIPSILPWMTFYLDAFYDLGSHRQIGLAEGPIPTLAILEYGRFYECENDDLEDLVFFVRRLDLAYMEHAAKKRGQ